MDPLAPVLGILQHVTRQEGPQYSDSITIGTPSKGGEIKIYGNLDEPDGFERRIREAFRLREIARELHERQHQGATA